jgi:hypothetical protein
MRLKKSVVRSLASLSQKIQRMKLIHLYQLVRSTSRHPNRRTTRRNDRCLSIQSQASFWSLYFLLDVQNFISLCMALYINIKNLLSILMCWPLYSESCNYNDQCDKVVMFLIDFPSYGFQSCNTHQCYQCIKSIGRF